MPVIGSIQGAKDFLLKAKEISGKDEILVSFSGGKESFVILDLCKELFIRVECVFWYWVKGLRCDEQFLKYAEARYDVPIHRVPSHLMINALRNSIYMPSYFELDKLRRMGQVDTENIIRKRTSMNWFAYGMRKDDSIERRAMITKSGNVDIKTRRVFPISDWRRRDVIAYLRMKKIPIPHMYGSVKSGGVSFSPESLRFLIRDYPDDFALMTRTFPYLEAFLGREQIKARKASEIHSKKNVKEGAAFRSL